MSINIYEFDIGYSKKKKKNEVVTFYTQESKTKNKMFKKKENQEDEQYKIANKIVIKERTRKEIDIPLNLYDEKLKNNDVLTKSGKFEDKNTNFYFYKNKYKVYFQKGNPDSYYKKGKPQSDKKHYDYLRDIFDIEIKLPSTGTDKESYIYRWDVKEDKVFIFGDLHGSFHTFFRSMMRLHYCGIIYENFEIKEGYRILFCGDIVDRGQYSLEILSFIFQLINKNEDKVYIIRGNHETAEIYQKKTDHNLKENLIDEFETKNLTEIQKTKVKNFINNSPVAIILVCNGKKIWCCHGSIPYHLDNQKICNIEELIKFIKNENNKENKIFECNKTLTTFIMWTDLYYERQRGYTIRGITSLKDIHYEKLKEYFKELSIDFMIRGHQDKDFNTTLYHGIEKYYYMSKKEYLEYEEKEKKSRIQYKYDYIYPEFGMPLLRFMMKDDKDKIIETTLALTISTNMDKDRALPRDSFIMVGPKEMNEDILIVPGNEELKLKAVYNLKIPVIKKEEKRGGAIIKFNNKKSKILKKYKNKKNNKKSKRIITKNIYNKKSKIKFSNSKINNRKIKTKKL